MYCFRCCVFCLLVVLAKLSLLAKWLARKTPRRKPNRGEGIISIKPRPKSAHDFLGLLYCFIVLLCTCVVSCPYVIFYPTVMARYSLIVLKVPLNPKQTNKLLSIGIVLPYVLHYFDGNADGCCSTDFNEKKTGICFLNHPMCSLQYSISVTCSHSVAVDGQITCGDKKSEFDTFDFSRIRQSQIRACRHCVCCSRPFDSHLARFAQWIHRFLRFSSVSVKLADSMRIN